MMEPVLAVKVPVTEPADTVAVVGTLKAEETLLASAIEVLAAGARERVRVHVVLELEPMEPTPHASTETVGGTYKETVAVAEDEFREAVRVADSSAVKAVGVAVKLALAEPAETVTVVGTPR